MAAINELKLSQMIFDGATNKFLEVRHQSLVIGPDLEMDREVKVTYFENNNGAPGIPTLQAIENDTEMHFKLKERMRDQFKTRIITMTTRGKMVDPSTGSSVTADENGAYPVGSVSELEFWQMVGRSALVTVDDGTISQSVYAALLYDMRNMVDNGVIV